MLDLHLKHLTNRVGERYRRRARWQRMMLCCVILSSIALSLWVGGKFAGGLPVWTAPGFLLCAAAALLYVLWTPRSGAFDSVWVARRIEEQHPELRSLLLTAVEQCDTRPIARDYLQQRVLEQAVEHARRHDWREVLPDRQLVSARRRQWAASLLLVAACTLLWSTPSLPVSEFVGGEGESATPLARSFEIEVSPGDVELERGSRLVVTARFDQRLPSDVTLTTAPEAGESLQLSMQKHLDDPVFAVGIPAVETDLKYSVEFDDQRSAEFRVKVFDYPRLLQADAEIAYPSYTNRPAGIFEDVRQVSAVQGSRTTLTFRLNKPVAVARLTHSEREDIECTAVPGAIGTYQTVITMQESAEYQLELIDDDNRRNKQPATFAIHVLENRRPDLKLTFPGRDQRVSPLEEMQITATAGDDFEVVKYGVVYAIGDTPPETVTLGEQAGAVQPVSHLLRMEDLDAKPDQLLSYYVWADDFGPDGKVRRTESDMYFAEVRHFDEIFRQGQSGGGGGGAAGGAQGQQGNEMRDLIRLQKQIVTATWKLHRKSSERAGSMAFGEELDVVTRSQKQALQMLTQLQSKLKDELTQQAAAEASRQMTAAVDALEEFADSDGTGGLLTAHTAERAAYQALLKLRAREHEVRRSQQGGGGGGGGGGGRSQQQLQQLELTKRENRYQSRRAAAPQQNSTQRETNQLLNRLRELARRQDDLNQQVKQLQSALQAAKTEQERKELERRLKRLREEQRELMRNADELRDRMQQSPQQAGDRELHQQVEQTRQNMHRASEALEKGQISQALNAGTRAQRQLQELRDDFRKKSAGAFSEEMQRMRDDARKLAENQQRISEEMQRMRDGTQKSLRDVRKKDQLAEQLTEQQQQLEEVMNQMRRVSQASETAEPLLAKQLYDTLRKTQQREPGELLRQTRRELARGRSDRAEENESQARKSIDQLKEGVEKAAESVLGNEVEALRRAKQELAELTQQLDREIERSKQSQEQAASAQSGGSESRDRADNQSSPSAQGKNPQQTAQQNREKSPSSGQSQGQSSNSQSQSQQAGGNDQPGGRSSASTGRGRPNQRLNLRDRSRDAQQRGGSRQGSRESNEGGFSGGPGGPITGGNFREWSDRLRDVEEMVEDAKFREEVAKVRDRARSIRAEFKRHSKTPNWSLVDKLVAQPLDQLQNRLREEIAKRESPESLVPIDRDPVPPEYREIVRRYYEDLGRGE